MRRVRFFYIIIFLITFFFALLVGGPMPYFLLYISILAFLIPLVHLFLSFIGVKASIKLPDASLHEGDSIDVQYNIKNRNFFSIPILKFTSGISKELSGKGSDTSTISLGPRENYKSKESVPLNRRGFYSLTNLKIEISDIYSLFNLKKEFKNKSKLLVYPNVIELDSFKIYSNKNLGEILVDKSIFKDKSSISSIDEYMKGDSISQIHWKASAKRGIPMVKSFDPVSDMDLNLFLDNNKDLFRDDLHRHIEDKMVEISAAIVNYFLNLDINISLNTFSASKPIEIKNKSKDDLRIYLETLAKFKANGNHKIEDLIEEKIYSFTDNSVVIIVTPALDKDIGELGMNLLIKNLIPIFIVVTGKNHKGPNIDENIKSKLIEESIDIYFIGYDSNIKEELEVKYG